MTPDERDAVESLLAAERERVTATEAALVAELESVIEASTQSNLDDEHDPEGATVGFERARVASLLAQARTRLSEIDEAAGRLRADAFGTCRVCGREIAPERLTAHPTAVTCVECAPPTARSVLRRR